MKRIFAFLFAAMLLVSCSNTTVDDAVIDKEIAQCQKNIGQLKEIKTALQVKVEKIADIDALRVDKKQKASKYNAFSDSLKQHLSFEAKKNGANLDDYAPVFNTVAHDVIIESQKLVYEDSMLLQVRDMYKHEADSLISLARIH